MLKIHVLYLLENAFSRHKQVSFLPENNSMGRKRPRKGNSRTAVSDSRWPLPRPSSTASPSRRAKPAEQKARTVSDSREPATWKPRKRRTQWNGREALIRFSRIRALSQ